jgi:biopolymer transport protein ExbD
VTPLVDVVLVLLIIFMVVTPLLEKDIAVRVPDTEVPVDPELIPDKQLVVRVTAAGDLSINWDKVERVDLVAKLKEVLERRRKPEDKVVFVIAEDGANYGKVVSVLDLVRQSGAHVLGMMTELPEEPAAPAPAP